MAPAPSIAATVRQGFSLVELLVVIAIVAVLAALLLPSVALVRDSASATHCLSNLRQIHLGAMAWSADHQGLLMPAVWSDPDPTRNSCAAYDVPPTVMVCPLAPGTVAGENGAQSYGINQCIVWPSAGPGTPGDGIYPWGSNGRYYMTAGNTTYSAVRCPSDKVYFCDATNYVAGYWWSIAGGRRHRGRAEIAWIDGHCSSEPADYAVAAPTGIYFYAP